MNPYGLLLINVISTWYLVGLIWTVQIVHYNLMDQVGADGFIQYERDHNRLITPVVGPIMVVELATSALMLIWAPEAADRWVLWTGLIAVLMIWSSTFFIQVPCHSRLLTGFDPVTHQQLLRTNWIRTVLWTRVRSLLICFGNL